MHHYNDVLFHKRHQESLMHSSRSQFSMHAQPLYQAQVVHLQLQINIYSVHLLNFLIINTLYIIYSPAYNIEPINYVYLQCLIHSISVHIKTQHFKANSSRDFDGLLQSTKEQDLFSSTSSSVNKLVLLP